MVATVNAVHTPVARLRRPVASARCPSTGAARAMRNPAAPIAYPSHAPASIGPGSPLPTTSVRYTENTKVRITAL